MATSRAPTEHYPAAMTTVGVAAGIFALCRWKQQTITVTLDVERGGDPNAGSHRCAFQMAAHSLNSWAGLRHGNGSDVGQTRATIPLTRKDQPKPIFWRLLNTNYHEHKHSKPLTRHN